MARQKGLFKVTGTLGAINYYVINGIGYARKAGGGFNGNAIRNQPNMQRVRENSSEFGNCSRIKKQFRLALSPFLSGIKGKAFHSRMMQLFLGIKALDGVSARGKRHVKQGLQTAKGKRMIQRYDFTPNNPLLDYLKADASFNWQSQALQIRPFDPDLFPKPKAATHIGVTLGVLDFDFDSLDWRLACSSTHFIDIAHTSSLINLVPDTVDAPTHFGVAVLGVRYYEIIAGEVYDLNISVGVGVLDCLRC